MYHYEIIYFKLRAPLKEVQCVVLELSKTKHYIIENNWKNVKVEMVPNSLSKP